MNIFFIVRAKGVGKYLDPTHGNHKNAPGHAREKTEPQGCEQRH